jgi:hypothetical protein
MAVTPMAVAPMAAAPMAAGPAAVMPAPVTSEPPALSLQGPAPQSAAPPTTFQEQKTEKPATDPEIKPIPHPDSRFNSMPAPLLTDPRDRTAARPNYPAIHLVASPVAATVPQDNDGWAPARN